MRPLPLLVSHPEKPESVKDIGIDLGFDQGEIGLAMRLYAKRIPPLVNRGCLPYLFGVSGRLVASIERKPAPFYRIYSITKATGGKRQIEAPRRFLKLIQAWINTRICSHMYVPGCVIGFVKGRSIFDNGKVHARSKNLMVVDIKDFFPNVNLEKVGRVFSSLGLPEEVSLQLGRLCCLDGRLPQGAPTSPALANQVFREADELLKKEAKRWHCRYTRYADDLAFSGSRRFTQKDVARVGEIIGRFGFSINRKKTRIVGQGARQILTGLVVNRKALPPREKRRLWRAIFHKASEHPREFSNEVSTLIGIASYVNHFSPTLREKYMNIAMKVHRGR